MNSDIFIDIFLQTLQEFGEALSELKRKDDERDRWRLSSRYEDDFEHDYGYESNYHNPYNARQCNKEFPTTLSEPMSKHQTQPKP